MVEIKACKVSNLTDARYFSAKGASIMGFDLDPNSPDFVSPDKLHAIVEWVDGVDLAGEFGLNKPDEIAHLANTLNLNFIQLPHFADPADALELKDHKIIWRMAVEPNQSPEDLAAGITDRAPLAWAVELDFDPAGIDPFDPSFLSTEDLNELLSLQRIFIKGPFSLKTIDRIQDLQSLPALSFSGGDEEKTGFKSYEAIDDILDHLEEKELYDPYR